MTKTEPTNPVTPSPMANNVVPLPAAVEEPRPSEKVLTFVKSHPVLTAAGAVAVGVAISALLPRKTGRKALGKALNLAEAAGAAALMFGRNAGEKAHDLGSGAKTQASLLSSKAGDAGQLAAEQLEKYGLAAVAAASALGRATAKRTGKLSETAAEKAMEIGQDADGRSQRVIAAISDLRKRMTH
ncbi:hypothetical protein [Novosphingobium album (ex Hu et al. 2023)]|uniref:Transmembrane protein n=1 Tax=Novosphingobium album (ex Hu et al. 2023) TaxID=2930093 RepID=A0ABT0AXM5_9SPHN|nr:hypothetical protein [Novosphingobium album (ex Hu et al. 2023)]MCJ2177542.1 hypothetical protein [Novosphingobium album (ex Hu et al. 2023)]